MHASFAHTYIRTHTYINIDDTYSGGGPVTRNPQSVHRPGPPALDSDLRTFPPLPAQSLPVWFSILIYLSSSYLFPSTRKDSFTTFAILSRVFNPRVAHAKRTFLLLSILLHLISLSLCHAPVLSPGFSHHRARLLSAFTFLPRHASRSRSLSLSFAFRARHSFSVLACSRRPRAKHTVSKLVRSISFPLICTRSAPTFSISFTLPLRCDRSIGVHIHIHIRAPMHISLSRSSHLFSLSTIPLFSFIFIFLSIILDPITSLSRRLNSPIADPRSTNVIVLCVAVIIVDVVTMTQPV